jgi:hypothetical protein
MAPLSAVVLALFLFGAESVAVKQDDAVCDACLATVGGLYDEW